MGRLTVRRPILRLSIQDEKTRQDILAVEEPLELRVNGQPLTITMRTPGHDVELAHGFLLSEGLINAKADISTARYCAGADVDGHNSYNVLDVTLASGVPTPKPGATRNFYTTSACGVCGKAALEELAVRSRFAPANDTCLVSQETLGRLPELLRSAQRVFAATGGTHAAGLFTVDGELLVVREDVGRHNAVDKVIGWAIQADRLPLRGCVLMVSARASFELTQKAMMAGVPILAAVSAPSSLAVELAESQGMTLIGFLRGESMNVYSGAERVFTRSLVAAQPRPA